MVWLCEFMKNPDSKVHGANMGPIWSRQDPGGPHVGPMNFAIWDGLAFFSCFVQYHNIVITWHDIQYIPLFHDIT